LAGEAQENAGTSPQSDPARRLLDDLLPVLDQILSAR
jgi:hypothetical protein